MIFAPRSICFFSCTVCSEPSSSSPSSLTAFSSRCHFYDSVSEALLLSSSPSSSPLPQRLSPPSSPLSPLSSTQDIPSALLRTSVSLSQPPLSVHIHIETCILIRVHVCCCSVPSVTMHTRPCRHLCEYREGRSRTCILERVPPIWRVL